MTIPTVIEHRCLAERCRRPRRPQDIICGTCHAAIAGMCRGKERVDGYTARRRGEKSGRGWYRCLACENCHQTRTRSGSRAFAARARAQPAIDALIKHRGSGWFAELVASWDPANGAAPRAGHTRPMPAGEADESANA